MEAFIAWLAANWVQISLGLMVADRVLQVLHKIATKSPYTWDDKAVDILIGIVDAIKKIATGILGIEKDVDTEKITPKKKVLKRI